MLAVYFFIGDLRMRLAVQKKEPTWTESLDKLLCNTSVMAVRATRFALHSCVIICSRQHFVYALWSLYWSASQYNLADRRRIPTCGTQYETFAALESPNLTSPNLT